MPQDAESPTYKAKDIRAVKKMQRRGKGLINSIVQKEYKEQIRWKLLLFGIIVSRGDYNPGQNVLGHLRKLGTKTHFAKLTHILPLKKAMGCCYKGLFRLSPSPPSSVDCVELKLECIMSTLHRGGRGEGRCLNLTSYCISVQRVLTRVVVRKTGKLQRNKLFNFFQVTEHGLK